MSGWLERWFPLWAILKKYRREDFRHDLVAGLTTGVMLVPQGMAYALLAGLPPIVGVYASLVPGVFYALLGTSRQLSVAPVAMDSLLVAASVGAIAQTGSVQYIQAAALLAVLVGLFQIAMGLFRLGFLVNFLSGPVISGFTSAAALIIGLSQAKHLLGVSMDNSARLIPLLTDLGRVAPLIQWETALLGGASILLLIALKKKAPKMPTALVAVTVGAVGVVLLGWQERVALVGGAPSGLPHLQVPWMSWETIKALVPAAATIALVSFMESISVAKTYARKNRTEVIADRELVALGMANFMGGLFRGYPVAGGFSRTAVNAEAGARTPVAGLITSAVVALSLVFLTPLFVFMPKAVLAAIIVTAVVGLVDVREVLRLHKIKKADLVLLAITFVATLGWGIVQGIAVGVVVSLAWFVYRTSRPHLAILGRVPGTQIFRNVARQKGLLTYEGVLILRMDAEFFFGNVSYLRDALQAAELAMKAPLRAVVLDASAINQLDSSAESALEDMWEKYRSRGIAFALAGVKGPIRDVLESAGLSEKMGTTASCLTVHQALALLRAVPESNTPPAPPSSPPPDGGLSASRASARL